MIICHKCKQPSNSVKSLLVKINEGRMFCPSCYEKRIKWYKQRGINWEKPYSKKGGFNYLDFDKLL